MRIINHPRSMLNILGLSSKIKYFKPFSNVIRSLSESSNLVSTEENQSSITERAPDLSQLQSRYAIKIKRDPKETSIVLFPGEGTEYTGMAENLLDFPNVPEMFEIASRILGYDLLEVCVSGGSGTLNQCDKSQAAIVVSSLAAVEKLRFERKNAIEKCFATFGYGVGEITALIFSGALTFEDGIRLVKIRGEAMKQAASLCPGGQMRILLHAAPKINLGMRAATEFLIRKGVYPEFAVCSVSAFLFPHAKVVAGHVEALEFLKENALDFGIKDCRPVPGCGAFHTRLMRPAADVVKEALKKIPVSKPLIAVHSNFDGRWYRNEEQIREKLGLQICSPIKLEQAYHAIYERPSDIGLPYTFECGPGDSMMKLLSKVNGRAQRQGFNINA